MAFSYRQTVRAYPSGGGSYTVARENLGTIPGLTAAAALMIDYVLTVAVSIVRRRGRHHLGGTGLYDERLVLWHCSACGSIVVGNLRGVRESGTIFAIPTYLFIFSFAAMLVDRLRALCRRAPRRRRPLRRSAVTMPRALSASS